MAQKEFDLDDYTKIIGEEIESVLEYIDIIDCIEFLEKLHDKIYHHDDLLRRQQGIHLCYAIPINRDAERIVKRIQTLTPEWYKTKIVTHETEIVNGYALTESEMFHEVDYHTYRQLGELWDEKDDLSYDEFIKQFKERACTDWNKLDEFGESFGGFWKSEDPEIQANAYELTRKHNCEMLWKLPFPKRFLLETVEIGCSRREESVRNSNHFGAWFQQKRSLEQNFYNSRF